MLKRNVDRVHKMFSEKPSGYSDNEAMLRLANTLKKKIAAKRASEACKSGRILSKHKEESHK